MSPRSLVACVSILVHVVLAKGQDSSSIKLSAYAEVYFGYDFARPRNGERPDFLYNHKRHQEFNANLALLRAEHEKDGIRAAVGLMAGNYAQYNLADEPAMLRSVQEASVGFRLSNKHDLWVDAGLFPSHIGFESVIGLECMTLTRSVMAENSPYFQAGAKLTFGASERVRVALLALNGWQRFQRTPGNSRPAFGTQFSYQDANGLQLNWSTFTGSIGPDSVGQWRYFNNLYAKYEGPNSGMVLGFDLGVQESFDGDGAPDGWFTVVAQYRQRVVGRWWLFARVEHFLDDAGLVIEAGSVQGATLGMDLRINERASWRLEGRLLGDVDKRFTDVDGLPTSFNTAITTAMLVKF
jgi:hypothetical protein